MFNERALIRIVETGDRNLVANLFMNLPANWLIPIDYGGAHLAAMMGDLRYPEFVDPLIDCMGQSAGDYICESAQTALAKIGDAGRPAVMGRWSGFDASQRIYGYGVLERTGGDEKTVQFLEERFGEVRSDPGLLECWCTAAEAVPHRKLLEMLEGELHRELYVVDDFMAELVKVNMAAESGLEYRGPIRFLKSSLQDGRIVSPAIALKEYLGRVERNPASVPDLLGLGNIYFYMESWKPAADCYDRCLVVQPECVEAAHNLAEIRLKKGDTDAAFKILEDAWRVRDRWRFHRLRTVSKEDFILAAKLHSQS